MARSRIRRWEMNVTFDPETEYKILNGNVVAYGDGTPFETTIYRLGNNYLAARSHQYRHANYEFEAMQR